MEAGKPSQLGWDEKDKRTFLIFEDFCVGLREARNGNTIVLSTSTPFLWSFRKILFPLWRTLLFLTCLGKNQGPMGQAPLPEIRTSPSGEWHPIHTPSVWSLPLLTSIHPNMGRPLLTERPRALLESPIKVSNVHAAPAFLH